MAPRNPATLLFEQFGSPERIPPFAPPAAPRLESVERRLPLKQKFTWEELSWISGISISRLREAFARSESAVSGKPCAVVLLDPASDYSTIT